MNDLIRDKLQGIVNWQDIKTDDLSYKAKKVVFLHQKQQQNQQKQQKTKAKTKHKISTLKLIAFLNEIKNEDKNTNEQIFRE